MKRFKNDEDFVECVVFSVLMGLYIVGFIVIPLVVGCIMEGWVC